MFFKETYVVEIVVTSPKTKFDRIQTATAILSYETFSGALTNFFLLEIELLEMVPTKVKLCRANKDYRMRSFAFEPASSHQKRISTKRSRLWRLSLIGKPALCTGSNECRTKTICLGIGFRRMPFVGLKK